MGRKRMLNWIVKGHNFWICIETQSEKKGEWYFLYENIKYEKCQIIRNYYRNERTKYNLRYPDESVVKFLYQTKSYGERVLDFGCGLEVINLEKVEVWTDNMSILNSHFNVLARKVTEWDRW